MQPIILTQLTSQLNQVIRLLELVVKYKEEFQVAPIVVINVPFSVPTIGQLKSYILDKYPLFSSINIRFVQGDSVEYIKTNFENFYVIYQDNEVYPCPNTYRWIDENIVGYEAILFHWFNPIAISNCWRIDMYVVRNFSYSPHVGPNAEFDCLEVSWGKYLIENNLNNYFRGHNSRDQKFKREALEVCPDALEVIKTYKDNYQESKYKRFMSWLVSW